VLGLFGGIYKKRVLYVLTFLFLYVKPLCSAHPCLPGSKYYKNIPKKDLYAGMTRAEMETLSSD